MKNLAAFSLLLTKLYVMATLLFVGSLTLAQTDNVVVDGVITLPVVQAGDDAYYLELGIVPDTDPIQLQPLAAFELFNASADKNTSSFDLTTGALDVPLLIFQDVPYQLNLNLSSSDPITLTLAGAEVLPAEVVDAPFDPEPAIPVSEQVDNTLAPQSATATSNPVLPQPFALYFIQTDASEEEVKCLAGSDVNLGNAPAGGFSYMADCRNVPDQIWQFFETNEFGFPGYFHITNAKPTTTEKCMESAFYDPATESGTGAYMNDCFTSDFNIFSGQLFKPSGLGGGLQFENFVRESFNECLDSNDSGGAILNGAVFMAPCDQSSTQVWNFVPFDDLNQVLDDDNDTIANAVDNCPEVSNVEQTDADSNGVGDACTVTLDNALEPIVFTIENVTGVTPGVVSGVIYGLQNNMNDQQAISVTITSFPPELGQLAAGQSLDAATWTSVSGNSFDVQGGQVVAAHFSAQNQTDDPGEFATLVIDGALNTPCCNLIRNGLTVNNGSALVGNNLSTGGTFFAELAEGEVVVADAGLVADLVDESGITFISNPMPGEYYFLQSTSGVQRGHCLEGNENKLGALARGASFQHSCQNLTGQQWRFEDLSSTGWEGYYRITNQNLESKNQCLDAASYDPLSANGRGVFMANCNADNAFLKSSQMWTLIPTGEAFKLQSLSHSPEVTNNCLQSNSIPSLTLDGAAFMESCEGDPGQQWRLVQASDFDNITDPTDTMIGIVGTGELLTINQFETRLSAQGLLLKKNSNSNNADDLRLNDNECQLYYVNDDVESDIAAKGGILACNKVDIDDSHNVTFEIVYGGCDVSDIRQGGGSNCEVGVATSSFEYQASDDPAVYETITAKGPTASECVAVSTEFTCLSAGVSGVSITYDVSTEAGSGAEVAICVGCLGIDVEFGVDEDGTVTVGGGLGVAIGFELKVSYNPKDGVREIYKLGRTAYSRTVIGTVIAAGESVAGELGAPSIDDHVMIFIDSADGKIAAFVDSDEVQSGVNEVENAYALAESGIETAGTAAIDSSTTFVNVVADKADSAGKAVVTFLGGLF